ncbi:hypothetical protein AB4865_02740 [Capnocytophaga sp. ARDL2]|uniref:hypothetical protein n=1 Tax=Capnocytophaga sp. ARDL2 TaxID=3238809 RepID=UPI003555C345
MSAFPLSFKKLFFTLLKIAISFGAFYFIFKQVQDKNWQDISIDWSDSSVYFTLIISFVLLVLNRFIEILKWHNLSQTLRNHSLWQSTKEVLVGITFGIVSPNGIGEYVGKTLFYEKKNALQVILLNALCNGIQVVYALVFGIVGVLFINSHHAFIPANYIWYVLIAIVVTLVLLFSLKNIKIKGKSIGDFIVFLQSISRKKHVKNIVLALVRYVVLMHQYCLWYTFFGVEISYVSLLAVIASIYLLSSSLPNFQIADFALKGTVGMMLFSLFAVDELIVAIVATLIWLSNIVIPISVGAIVLLFTKFDRNNKLIDED